MRQHPCESVFIRGKQFAHAAKTFTHSSTNGHESELVVTAATFTRLVKGSGDAAFVHWCPFVVWKVCPQCRRRIQVDPGAAARRVGNRHPRSGRGSRLLQEVLSCIGATNRPSPNRGRDGWVGATPPSEPDGRIPRIRLSSGVSVSPTRSTRAVFQTKQPLGRKPAVGPPSAVGFTQPVAGPFLPFAQQRPQASPQPSRPVRSGPSSGSPGSSRASPAG
jgi:hypothetical protein